MSDFNQKNMEAMANEIAKALTKHFPDCHEKIVFSLSLATPTTSGQFFGAATGVSLQLGPEGYLPNGPFNQEGVSDALFSWESLRKREIEGAERIERGFVSLEKQLSKMGCH
ncbi:hypothetical protein KUW19_00745 [Ferrimonas balearica]|uniref:hypothetical protein n=1 Tax=Ferrimonas balearica TaxID=44012 RepID=UPI001C94890A|nr:hypothetical protein [Ferrimonas balearica]MBY6105004.1 hypothetical protein [Ferrimonas balearica]